MGLSFHDKQSLDETVGSLCFASDPRNPNSDSGSNDIVDQERREDDIGDGQINDIEMVDR